MPAHACQITGIDILTICDNSVGVGFYNRITVPMQIMGIYTCDDFSEFEHQPSLTDLLSQFIKILSKSLNHTPKKIQNFNLYNKIV